MDVKKETKSLSVSDLLKPIAERLTPDALSHPICFALSFLLSKSVLLGSLAPFGLSASGALGTRRGSVCALLGGCLGYITMLDTINSLKYIACIILIYTAHFVFNGMTVSKSKLFAAVSVIVPMVCINLVFLADASFPLFDTALSLFDIGLATVCTVLFSILTDKQATSSALFPVALLTLFSSLILPLCKIELLGVMSLGNVLIFLLVLLSAHTGGTGTGVLISVILGVFASLSASSPELSMLCGVLGIIMALFSPLGKLSSCLFALPFTLFLAACFDPSKFMFRSFELLAAGGLFLLSSSTFSRYMRHFFIRPSSPRDIYVRTYATERLNLAAKAFSSLEQIVGETQRHKSRRTQPDENAILERTSREVCKGCPLSEVCWQHNFNDTRDAMNNAVRAIKKNGTLSAKDFPIHFSSRCLKIEGFVNIVNREIFSAKYKNSFDKKLQESHGLLTRQYKEVSSIFSSISSDISDNARFDEEAEIALSNLLASYGILCDTAVYRDHANHLNVHLCGKDLSLLSNEFEKLGNSISTVVGVALSSPQYTHGQQLDDIIMRELPPLKGVFGAAVKRRCGSEISGDSGSFFCPVNGHIALLLSDGMGSGRLAAAESATNVTLLENLLKSGISPQNALNTLQGVLTLRSEYTSSFATLDLMYADMFSGECEFFKFGGAPTYIKRGRHIRRITSSSLPAGMSISISASPDRTTLTLLPGDFVVMTSDGICDNGDDKKIVEFLSKADEASPKALADSLLAYSLTLYGKNDDMSVAAVLIEENI